MDEILSLYKNFESLILAFALLMVRMMTAFSLLPLFSRQTVPMSVRISFVGALTIGLLPLVGPQNALVNSDWVAVLPYFLKEAGLGVIIGLTCSLIFYALHTAGSIIEYQAGLTMSTAIDPLSGQEDSVIGGLLMQLFTILFIISGGILSFIGMLFESYRIWPVNQMQPLFGNLKLATQVVGGLLGLIEMAVKIAVPFVILMLVAEIALALLSRFAPQLNVFFLSLPIKIIILASLLLLFCLLLSDATQLLPSFPLILRKLNGAMQ